MQNDKIKVAILYGGRSSEHEVSVVSATNVIQHLDRSRFEAIPIGIDKQGSWFLGDDIFQKELSSPVQQKMLRLQREENRMLFNPDSIAKNLKPTTQHALQEKGPLFDVVFPVLHGTFCEDGVVQGLLEVADIPYVGCGVLASAVGMDKDVSKRLVMHAGINVAPFLVINRGLWERNADSFSEKVKSELHYPVFVKPVNSGSSVGISKVKRPEDLAQAINAAFQYDVKVIVEKAIDAIEIEVAVLEAEQYGADPLVSIPGEIRPTAAHEYYSYASKYIDEQGSEFFIPAPISMDLQVEAREMAKTIFSVLECEGMARVDLFVERGTNKIYFNEVNSIPGFTQISMYPKLMGATGVSYSDLLTKLIHLAMARHMRKSQLKREFVTV